MAALRFIDTIGSGDGQVGDVPGGRSDLLPARLKRHFSELEMVEIGYFVSITMGQQRRLRTLNIEHHQILAGTEGSMAPGFETWEQLQKSKAEPSTGRARAASRSRRRRSSRGHTEDRILSRHDT